MTFVSSTFKILKKKNPISKYLYNMKKFLFVLIAGVFSKMNAQEIEIGF
jgi:hypothetical protein